jgi:predicted RNase H-like HicB family nuclease
MSWTADVGSGCGGAHDACRLVGFRLNQSLTLLRFQGSIDLPIIRGMATHLQYIEAAMNCAVYEKTEDGGWFASIPGLTGLWATGRSKEAARKDLHEALEGWIEVTAKTGNRVPDVGGVSLHNDLRKVASH